MVSKRLPVRGSAWLNVHPHCPYQERDRGDEDVVDVLAKNNTVVVNEEKVKVDLTKYVERHAFKFDEALDEGVSNEAVYQLTVGPLVRTLFRAGRASCFAYGQTGSGKTYTMSPLPIRASADIFRYMASEEFRDITLCVSCFEIYGNKVGLGLPVTSGQCRLRPWGVAGCWLWLLADFGSQGCAAGPIGMCGGTSDPDPIRDLITHASTPHCKTLNITSRRSKSAAS